ncbi:MAG: ABC transporter substrate binding protein [Gammaproteobacteria bacterium]
MMAAARRKQAVRARLPVVPNRSDNRSALTASLGSSNTRNYFTQFAQQWTAAAAALKLELRPMEVRRHEELRAVFRAAHQAHADAIVLVGDPLVFRHRMHIHDLAAEYRLPTFQPTKEYLAGRGLLSYGPSLDDLVARAAVYVDRILRGGTPARLPVEQPRRYDLVVNLKAAKALGLTIPPSVLLRADEIIE